MAEGNEGMAEVSKRGRPKGSRTSTVDLETVSFKAPVEFMTRLRVYAKQRRQSLSELIRDGLEWRLSDIGDPLTLRSGEVGGDEVPAGPGLGAVLESLLSLTEEVYRLREELREARVGRISGNTRSTAGGEEVRQVREEEREGSATGMPGDSGNGGGGGEIRRERGEGWEGGVVGISGNTRSAVEVEQPEVTGVERQELIALGLDPAKWKLGKLCKGGHEYPGKPGQTLYRLPKFVCPKCDADRAKERRARKRNVT
jgi:hypothetical protein